MSEELEMVAETLTLDDDNLTIRSGDIVKSLNNEAEFESGLQPLSSVVKKNWYKVLVPPEPIRSSILPPMTMKEWKSFFFTHLPVLGWIWTYQINYLVRDIIAGITVAVMHVPQGLAYSQLAGLDPVYGLYASFIPVLIYSLLGTSKHLSVGTFAVVSLMVSNAVEDIMENHGAYVCSENCSKELNGIDMDCSNVKLDIAVTLSFLSGIFMVIMGVCQFGFITIFLSESLVSGYTTGAAVHVFTSQIKHIFGLSLTSQRGLLSVPYTWHDSLYQLSDINITAFIISFFTITALIVLRVINRQFLTKISIPCSFYSHSQSMTIKKKFHWPIPIPSQLIVVIVATAMSYGANFKENFHVNTIDHIPLGLPSITTPTFAYVPLLLKDAVVISIVTFSISVSLSQVFAKQFSYTVNSSQELIAYGAMNFISSFFSCFNTAGSLSRSNVQAVSGGKTQFVGFVSSFIMFVVLIALGHLFEPLPNAVLASIIWVALYGMFAQVVDIWRYFKLAISDMLTWVVVFVATVLLGVDWGLGVGVLFSLLTLLVKLILPKSSLLAKIVNTETYHDIDGSNLMQSIKGVIIYRFQAPLCFVNCKVLQSRLDLVCGIERSCYDHSTTGCIQVLLLKVLKFLKKEVSFDMNPEYKAHNSTNSKGIHTLVLDCSSIGFIDAMGAKALQKLILDYDNFGIQVLLSSLTTNNSNLLRRVEFFKKYGTQWFFPSVESAIKFSSSASRSENE